MKSPDNRGIDIAILEIDRGILELGSDILDYSPVIYVILQTSPTYKIPFLGLNNRQKVFRIMTKSYI